MPVPPFSHTLTGEVSGLRVGLPKEYFGEGIDGEVRAALERTVAALRERGATIVDISLPHTHLALAAYYIVAPAEASSNLARYDGIRFGKAAQGAKDLLDLYMKTRGEGVEFWIGGPGEEVHGTATALALHHVVREGGRPPGDIGLFLHYRSDALAAMTTALRGEKTFVLDYFRQALSRITDPHSGGRQMVMHLCRPELGIWPVQSPVGMQLGKAAGATGWLVKPFNPERLLATIAKVLA